MTSEQALTDARQHLARRNGLRGAWFPIVVLVCFILMGLTLLVLAVEVRHLISVGATRSDQVNTLTVHVQQLQSQVDNDQRLFTEKDARIKQLTDALLKAGLAVPAPTVTVIVQSPQQSPSPSPTPAPAPTPTRPTPRPTVSPGPSPTCRVPVPPPISCPRGLS